MWINVGKSFGYKVRLNKYRTRIMYGWKLICKNIILNNDCQSRAHWFHSQHKSMSMHFILYTHYILILWPLANFYLNNFKCTTNKFWNKRDDLYDYMDLKEKHNFYRPILAKVKMIYIVAIEPLILLSCNNLIIAYKKAGPLWRHDLILHICFDVNFSI